LKINFKELNINLQYQKEAILEMSSLLNYGEVKSLLEDIESLKRFNQLLINITKTGMIELE
jgi:hypothetical protein